MKNKSLFVLIAVFLLIAFALLVYYFNFSETAKIKRINSYSSCIAAGYPSLESFPPQCKTPDGRTFVGTELLTPTDSAKIANPASDNCKKLGGTLEIKDEMAGQVGYCTLPNGKVCEEWALLRGECK